MFINESIKLNKFIIPIEIIKNQFQTFSVLLKVFHSHVVPFQGM